MPDWDLPSPHVHAVVVGGGDIDDYGHVNNAVYVSWLDQAAWSHSAALGLPSDTCVVARRGMVVWRTQLNYLAPAFDGDSLVIGTWIVRSDGRLRVERRFQIRHAADGRTLLRALVQYACIDLDSGRPKRMPPQFVQGYRPLDDVAAAAAAEPQPFAPGVEPAA
jgi:acyl-CoA thioester hydrolase